MINLKRIWKEISSGNNLDVYATVAIAFIAIALDLFGVANQSVVLSIILAVLALLALGLLHNRRVDEELHSKLDEMKLPSISSKQFFQPEFFGASDQLILENASHIFLWGIAFERTIPLLRDRLANALTNGATVQILIIKPETDTSRMGAFRSNHHSEASLNRALHKNIDDLASMTSKVRNSGKLDVRLIDYLPPYSIIGVNPEAEDGKLFVNLMSFNLQNEKRPAFSLTAMNDGEWYEHFLAQFNAVWERAEPI